MKVKQDFVTNSSSSSFIVAFDKPVESLDEIKGKIMFIEKAEAVFKDIQDQKPLRIIKDCPPCLERISEEVGAGYFEGYNMDYPRINRSDFATEQEYFKANRKAFDEHDKINKKKAKQIAEKFIEQNEGKVAYFFSYSDNDGEFWSEMEHGDTFRNFPHVTISHH